MVGRIPMVEFLAPVLGDDGADEEERGGHNQLRDANYSDCYERT